MSETMIRVAYEGKKRRISLSNPTFSSLEVAVKGTFDLTEVELVARLKDDTEYDVRDDEELEKYINNTLDSILVYEYHQNPLEIKLGNEKHSLDVIPESNSALVRYAKGVVIPEFNLPKFVDRLGDSARYVRRTFYHLLACEKHMMAKDVDTLTSTVLKPLMEHCRLTFDLNVSTTRDMVQLLQEMFEFAREGTQLNDLATKNSKCLGEMALKMKNEAGERVTELTDASEKMDKVVNDILTKYAEGGIDESKSRRSLADKEEECKEHRDEHGNVYWWFAWLVAADSYKKLTRLEKEQQGLSKKQEEVSKIVKYLSDASSSIKQARAIVQEMHTFWTKMENAGKSLAHDELFFERTEMAVGCDMKAKRLRQTTAYKRQALRYISRIVAIRDVSVDCSKQLNLVGADIDAVLVETPTRDEALAKLEEMSIAAKLPKNTIQYGLEDKDTDPATKKAVAEVFSLSIEATD